MSTKPVYSVVIPVYNSSESLFGIVDRIYHVFSSIVKDKFEIIFIDDNSPNVETQKSLKKLSKKFTFVNSYQLTKNFGQGGATMAGLSVSKGDWIITMDDDLQHNPEDIPLLLSMKEHDVVIAKFIKKQSNSLIKTLGSKIKGYSDNKLLGLERNIKSTAFKLIKSQVVKNMLAINTSRPFIIALILNVTSDIVNVEVVQSKRIEGESNYNLKKSFKLFSNLLISNSPIMLRLINLTGFVFSIISLLFGIILIINKILNPGISQGWTSIMVVSFLNLGILLFCLGIIGEYLYRIQEISNNKPAYIIKSKL